MKIIKYKRKKIALISKFNNFKKNTINFLTNENDEFQVAKMSRDKNYEIKAHYHPKRLKKIYRTSEVLILLKGKIKVKFYNSKNIFFSSRIINTGDMIIFFSGGHEFKFLKKSSLIEVKQGPYNKAKDKKFIK